MRSRTLDVGGIVAYDVGVPKLPAYPRRRRRRAVAALAVALVGGAGCADDAACPSAGQFALTAPDGFVQVGPSGTATIAWTADGDPGATVALRAIATDGVADVALPPALLGAGQLVWDARDGAGARVPAANYRVGGEVAAVGGCGGLTLTPDDLHLIVVMGVRLPTAPLAFVGSQTGRVVEITTVTRVSVPLELALDPDPAVAGDELIFASATVPGEFTPIARAYPFPGTTTAGAAIPAGGYDLVATFAGTTTRGPRVTWDPAP